MNILFVGYFADPKSLSDYSGVSVAGQNYQINFLESLHSLNKINNLRIISIPPVSVYPIDKRINLNKKSYSIDDNLEVEEIGFVNIPIIKQLMQVINTFILIRKHLTNTSETLIVQFNLFPQTGIPVFLAHTLFKKKVVSILADLPINDNPNLTFFSRTLRGIFDWFTINLIQYFDNFIILNDNVANKYTKNKNNLVIPGGVKDDLIRFNVKEHSNRRVLYSGALTEYSGVLNFIESLKFIQHEDITFEIFGSGYLSQEIIEIAKQNKRIRFGGQVTHQEILNHQNNAWLLINPRPINDPISQFTFPSKIFEYLLSGTPVLTTQLNGFDDKFLNYVFHIDDNTPEIIASKINEIYEIDSNVLIDLAENAQNFVKSEYSWTNLANKVFEYLYQINSEDQK